MRHSAPIQHLHLSESGVRQASIDFGPRTYAQELARYISCPSTIRARVLDRWGKSPTLRQIEAMRHLRVKARVDFRNAAEQLGEADEDAMHFRVGSLVPVARLRKPVVKVKAEPTPVDPAPIEPESPATYPILPREIIAAIAKEFGFSFADVSGPSRLKYINMARKTAAYVLHRRGSSYSQIGRWLGGRDHTTILYAKRQFEAQATDFMLAVAERWVR